MKLDPFLAHRREGWGRLSELLNRLQRTGPGTLTLAEIEELGRLYRRAASDLAYARSQFNDPETVSYLNQLVARGHGALYAPRRARWGHLWRFWAREYPRQVRAALVFCLLAALFLYGSAGVAALVALVSPDSADLLLPEGFSQAVRQGDLPAGSPEDLPAAWKGLLGSFIVTNNIKVGFISFGMGIAFGAGTAYVLVQNGLMLGAICGLVGHGKNALAFWSLIAPHGGMELLAICLCGGAGLLLGWALISPGDYSRREALALAARRAIPLVLGTVPIFGVAALVEAFVTPLPGSAEFQWVKIAIGPLGAAAVLIYLATAGRTTALSNGSPRVAGAS